MINDTYRAFDTCTYVCMYFQVCFQAEQENDKIRPAPGVLLKASTN